MLSSLHGVHRFLRTREDGSYYQHWYERARLGTRLHGRAAFRTRRGPRRVVGEVGKVNDFFVDLYDFVGRTREFLKSLELFNDLMQDSVAIHDLRVQFYET